ncbi:hypothetical protein E0H75_36210 [Kribbella capetownensis]|uniref:Two-component sensor histidine kinase n=1 Tax=Kribbella capetownensis TaxID=1572659 RepID=A0A4R0JI24_9ACTN|nr:hypothetical protein [Kribbella capetownensis]TCC44288.1 hypothetical protein E0H75_36210 [Kribbella capetownensis]
MTPRRSVLVRLLVAAVLVSLCSIAATAWLATRSTTVAIQQQRGRALADGQQELRHVARVRRHAPAMGRRRATDRPAEPVGSSP